MPKKIFTILSVFFLLGFLFSFLYAQEEITITTYYPSPFGSYRELETEKLFFIETNNGLISFNDVNNDNIYNRRLRITAGESDTGHNDQGASIDLQGNAAGGRLDLVAGRDGYTSFWTSPAGTTEAERMRITGAGNVGIGTASPGAKLNVGGTAGTDGIMFPDGTVQTTAAAGFGSWTDRDSANNTLIKGAVYKATSDGFICAVVLSTSSEEILFGYTDSNNPPMTIISVGKTSVSGPNGYGGITMPVRKNYYWGVTHPATVIIYWLPIR